MLRFRAREEFGPSINRNPAPSPPKGGEGWDEGASRESELGGTPPRPDPPPRPSSPGSRFNLTPAAVSSQWSRQPSTQTVLAQHPYGAGLRAVLGPRLGKCAARAGRNMPGATEDAI